MTTNHRPWVNFKELRSRLRFEAVLIDHKIEIQRKGDQHVGPCPLPSHPRDKRGPTFSANLERGIFQCFACKAKGNVLDFAGLMAGVDIGDGAALREVAVQLQERYFPEGASTRRKAPPTEPAALKSDPQRVLINAPLDFALKDLDHRHPLLLEFGLSHETFAYFGVGFCARGSLKGRIAIPLHEEGRLVGYASAEAGNLSSLDFPQERERDGARLRFDPSRLVYNANRISGPCNELIVATDIPTVWRLYEHTALPAVAVCGDGMTERQCDAIAALLQPSGRIRIVPGSPKNTLRIVEALSLRHFVRVALCDGSITTLTPKGFDALLA